MPSNPQRLNITAMLKSYLADGVYVEFIPPFTIEMYSSNGVEQSPSIYLDPSVLEALDRYRKRIAEMTAEEWETEAAKEN